MTIIKYFGSPNNLQKINTRLLSVFLGIFTYNIPIFTKAAKDKIINFEESFCKIKLRILNEIEIFTHSMRIILCLL